VSAAPVIDRYWPERLARSIGRMENELARPVSRSTRALVRGDLGTSRIFDQPISEEEVVEEGVRGGILQYPRHAFTQDS
jgi:hypothetical protein